MAQPDVGEVAEQLYDYLGPLTAGDEERGWPLLLFCDALTGGAFEQIHVYASDREDRPGWQIVFDPDDAPVEVLPYLAMFVGVELMPNMSETEQREAIKRPDTFIRGTPETYIAAGQRTLTGEQVVVVDERFNGSAWQVRARTRLVETPDPTATEAAFTSQKPVGIVQTYEAVDGQSWDDLQAAHADWDAVLAAYDDWDELRLTLPI